MAAFQLTPREVLSILFKEYRKLLAIFFVILLVFVGVSFLVTRSYQATSKVLVKSGREFENRSDPGQNPATVPYVTKQEIINSEMEILTSRDLAEATIESIGIDKVYPDIASDPPTVGRPIDAAVKAFTKDFKPDAIVQSEVIALDYFNPDPNVAVAVLSKLIDLYQQKHAVIFGAHRSDFLEQQVNGYQSQIDDVTKKIAQLRESDRLYDVSSERSQLYQDRSSVAGTLRDLESRASGAQNRITYYQGALKTLQPLVQAGSTESESVETAKSKIIDLQAQLMALRQRYATDTKLTDDLQEQIGLMTRFVDGRSGSSQRTWMTRNPAYDDAVVKLQAAQAEDATLETQIGLQKTNLAAIDARLLVIEQGSRSLENLERNHDILDNLIRTSRLTLEQARTDEDLDKQRIISVEVLEHPSATTTPVKPRRLFFALAGVALGGAATMLFVVYLLAFRETLITAESVERLLKLKVLTSIPAAS